MMTEREKLAEWRVQWCECPTNHNTPRITFVTAATSADAGAIVIDWVERTLGLSRIKIQSTTTPEPVPAGQILNSTNEDDE